MDDETREVVEELVQRIEKLERWCQALQKAGELTEQLIRRGY